MFVSCRALESLPLHPISRISSLSDLCVLMLRWCAYCQEFQGEIPPFDKFTTTHGICNPCKAKGWPVLEEEIPHSHLLRHLQWLLYKAGKTGDVTAAPSIVTLAVKSGLRPVDILLGIVTPLLHQVGDDWESGLITIYDQQRFSSFYERVFEIVQTAVSASLPIPIVSRPIKALLVNAGSNIHTLGIRIVGLNLQFQGIENRVVDPSLSSRALVQMAIDTQPKAILISIAMALHRPYVFDIAQAVSAMPYPRPVVIVGGNAIKHNLVSPVAGTIFLDSIADLPGLICAPDSPTKSAA